MSIQVIKHIYKLKRGSEEAVFEANPILGAGEPVVVFCDGGVTRLKIGDGKHHYNDLPFINEENDRSLRLLLDEVSNLRTQVNNAGDSVFILNKEDVNNESGETISTRITNYLLGRNPTERILEGHIAIISGNSDIDDSINETKSYVYTDDGWRLIKSTPSIDDVIFDDDIMFTEQIGSLEIPADKGHGMIAAKGKTIKDVLQSILVKRRDPNVTQPSVRMNAPNMKPFEVGTKVKVSFEATLDEGSYEFDDSTGVKFSDKPRAYFNDTIKWGLKATFDEVLVEDDTNLNLAFFVSYNKGDIPTNNVGEPSPSSRISDGEINYLHQSNLVGFRKWFYGYKNGDNQVNVDYLSSSTIRNLTGSDSASFPSTLSTTNMKQMFFALPKDVIKGVKVANSVNGAPQTVKHKVVEVEGKDGYNPIEYDVFYVDNDNASTSSDTYKITINR